MTPALVVLARSLDAAERDLAAPRRSLAPGRARATSLAEVARAVVARQPPPDAVADATCAALGAALADLAAATRAHFPENVFCDLDYPAEVLWRAALAAADPPGHLAAHARVLVDLHAAFGRGTAIGFRYVHDFLYGFDWARWRRKDPGRRGVGPFDLPFLHAMHTRAAELLVLIAADDAKYRKLAPGTPRNPFLFSREPLDEERLHLDLATRGLVPVETWRVDATPRDDLAFSDAREARARELGLARRA